MPLCSQQMPPSLVANNSLDGPPRNSISPRHLDNRTLLFGVESTNLSYLFVFQLRKMLGFPTRAAGNVDSRRMPMLTHHVLHVVIVGTKEQMSRPNTWRVVTVVADVQPRQKHPIRQLIGQAVCPDNATIDVNDAIAIIPLGSSPEPASLGARNVGPETFGKGETVYAAHADLHTGGE